MVYEIRERTDLPVKYVIDTDSRGDHVLGNEAFVDFKAEIVSSTAAEAAMRRYRQDVLRRLEADGEEGFRMRERMRGIHFTLPGETFDDHITLMLGGQEIRLRNLGGGPSPGDLVVFLPQAKVAFLGDWYDNGYIPNLQGVDLKKWIQVLQQMESWDVDIFVPGRGAPGNKQAFGEFVKFIEWAATETPAGANPAHLRSKP
jgi:glyoxylase-like metal-dependent hydrolase (beta-lactamase superfamily II)